MTPELKAKLATLAAEKRKRHPKPADLSETDLLVALDYVRDALGIAELVLDGRKFTGVFFRYAPVFDFVIGPHVPHVERTIKAGPGRSRSVNIYPSYMIAPFLQFLHLDTDEATKSTRTINGVTSIYWNWLVGMKKIRAL